MNAVEIEEAISALAERPFAASEFPYLFLEAFGNRETTLKRLRNGASNKSDIGGVLQTNNIHIATCQPGEVTNTLAALKASPATARAKARFVLATDGDLFEAEDLTSDDAPISCAYGDFPNHFGFFLPLAGITTVKQVRESSFDIRATSRLNKLYVELLRDNPAWGTAARRPDMNHFMARLIFCFFAEDTDIFAGSGTFTEAIETMSAKDSSNTHEIISTLFRAMNTNAEYRASEGIPRWADRFPYVNGGLFSGSADVPRFSRIARSFLLHIGGLDWKKINPDIFGSMIQAVADEDERGSLGMHYTSVPNILKVLNPLFLDELRSKFDEARGNHRMLLNLRRRLSRIRVFDPACGSGNFLVIAYKELRAIEAAINGIRGEPDRRSEIPLTNFRGIELRDFPAEIARLALIIAEYQCDVLYRGQKEALKDLLPLDSENWITCGNALRLDWLSICPSTGNEQKHQSTDLFDAQLDGSIIDFANEGGETYICGNPPYLGSKKKSQEQVFDMEQVGLRDSKLLDYVAAFILKANNYKRATKCDYALVSTSSICQGEQVALIWPRILEKSEILFAYRPFRWSNLASGNAGVWCTIVGVGDPRPKNKILYDGDVKRDCAQISPYLVQSSVVAIAPRKQPLSALQPMTMGSNPVDGKCLIFTRDEYEKAVSAEPEAACFFKPYGGTEELITGRYRYCLWIEDKHLDQALKFNIVAKAIESCRSWRLTGGQDARRTAKTPHKFSRSTYQEKPGLHVGLTIGNGFHYIPAAPTNAGLVSSHTAYMLYGWHGPETSIILSRMMRVWNETIGGRLGNGVRFSNTVVYNNFPVPMLTAKNRSDLSQSAEQILLAREACFPMNLAELYQPQSMPDQLRAAHDHNDELLERIYIGRRFKNDTERLEAMFEIYKKMTTGPISKQTSVGH